MPIYGVIPRPLPLHVNGWGNSTFFFSHAANLFSFFFFFITGSHIVFDLGLTPNEDPSTSLEALSFPPLQLKMDAKFNTFIVNCRCVKMQTANTESFHHLFSGKKRNSFHRCITISSLSISFIKPSTTIVKMKGERV